MHPLVSIITPCYNGEAYVDRYFQSILAQTYPNIELIFVNDGATDNTEKIALSYKDKLEEKGIIFKYIYKENGGIASAINRGLPLVEGKYWIWPDSDDYLSPDSIEKRVEFLETYPDMHFCRTDSIAVDEDTLEELYHIAQENDRKTKDIYLELILDHTYCTPGAYMVRFSTFKEFYPSLHIDQIGSGQDWQILLPFAAKYPCGYVEEGLYYYVVRSASLSHQERPLEAWLKKYGDFELLLYTLTEKIGRNDRDYKKIIDAKVLRTRIDLYVKFNKKKEARESHKALVKMGECSLDYQAKYLKKFEPINYFFFKVKHRIKGAMIKVLRLFKGKNENS